MGRPKKSEEETGWKKITKSIGYGLFVLVLVYVTFVVSKRIGLNMGICPFIIPGCSN